MINILAANHPKAAGTYKHGNIKIAVHFFLFLGLWFLLFISCKTVPRFPDPVLGESGYIPLEPGAEVYVLADVQRARPILELVQIRGMDEKRFKQTLDRTRSAVAALFPSESGRRFQMTAWGSYPGSGADMAFGTNKNWKKLRSAAGGLPYWHSARDGLSVALNAKQAFVSASLGDTPDEPFASPPGIEAPDGFDEFRRGALIACWLENPGATVNRIFTAMQIPLQLPAERLFVSVFPVAGEADSGGGEAAGTHKYEALLRIQVSSAAQARGVASLFALAGAFFSGGAAGGGPAALASIFFANPPVLDGQNLNIKTAVLTEKEIALLFSIFSVYSG
jgi:hypothetical protein